MKKWLAGWLGVACLLAFPARALPLRVLTIGDSMSEEYAFELPFSAPDSNPAVANVSNWIELLSARRAADVTAGSYNSALASYPDLRNGGYKYNFGVPSFKTTDWVGVVQATIPDWRLSTRLALENQLAEVDVVVVFLGGNDLKSNWTGIFWDAQPPALLTQTVTNLATIHDYIRARAPVVPIVIATAPDIGITPAVTVNYNDPARIPIARSRVAAMNAAIVSMAAARNATVARVDQLTDRIYDEHPLHLNGTVFSPVAHPENPPLRVFCKDGFHPATMAQALVADILIDALNRATGRNIARFANREVLGPVLGLNPDQPFLDWAAGAGGFAADPDGDGLPNLTEYVLGTAPGVAGSPLGFDAGQGLRFPVSAVGQRFATLVVEDSADLTGWAAVPAGRIVVQGDGSWRVAPVAGAGTRFYRLDAVARP